MFVPPGAGRYSPSPGAILATSQKGKNRPHPLPYATIIIPRWSRIPSFFSRTDAKAIISETNLKLTSGATPTLFAKSLSTAAYRFFHEAGTLPPSPAGARADWAKDVVKNARALLANFGMDPDTFVFSPPPDALAVLFAADYPRELPLCTDTKRTASTDSKQTAEEARKTFHFQQAMQLRQLAAPSTPQEDIEWLSLCGGVPNASWSDEPREAIRATLMGLAFLARQAAFTADFYRRKKKHRGLTPRLRFALQLSQIYQQTFGKTPTYWTLRATYGGPAIGFFTAVAERLRQCEALPGADPALDQTMRQLLTIWATSPAAIRDVVRDVRAINPRAGTWRRRRDGKTVQGPSTMLK
jgi:hypothetical protein